MQRMTGPATLPLDTRAQDPAGPRTPRSAMSAPASGRATTTPSASAADCWRRRAGDALAVVSPSKTGSEKYLTWFFLLWGLVFQFACELCLDRRVKRGPVRFQK